MINSEIGLTYFAISKCLHYDSSFNYEVHSHGLGFDVFDNHLEVFTRTYGMDFNKQYLDRESIPSAYQDIKVGMFSRIRGLFGLAPTPPKQLQATNNFVVFNPKFSGDLTDDFLVGKESLFKFLEYVSSKNNLFYETIEHMGSLSSVLYSFDCFSAISLVNGDVSLGSVRLTSKRRAV